MPLKTQQDQLPELNLTPMIDVVFQLLVFFMVATTFLDPEKEIDIELPECLFIGSSHEMPIAIGTKGWKRPIQFDLIVDDN